jgi:hypothetical protein
VLLVRAEVPSQQHQLDLPVFDPEHEFLIVLDSDYLWVYPDFLFLFLLAYMLLLLIYL